MYVRRGQLDLLLIFQRRFKKFITDTYVISIFQYIGKLNDLQKSNIKILIITILEGIICELGSWQVLGELVE